MNIQEQIIKWHEAYARSLKTDDEIIESHQDLELVLYAFDTLTDKVLSNGN